MAKRRRGKLELDWVDKGDIIITKFDENGKSYPASYRQGQVENEELMPRELELIETVGDSNSENMLIQGENLIALRSLEREFAGKIKLIYIDPPFNTGQDFEDYEDGLEHSIWLTIMENRLRLAEKLLSDDGVIFVHIDDNELAHLKTLLDDIFHGNYQNTIIWQRTPEITFLGQGQSPIINIVEYLLVYSKDKSKGGIKKIQKKLPATSKVFQQYNLYVDLGKPKKLVKKLNPNGRSEIAIFEYKDFEIEPIHKRIKNIKEYLNDFSKIYRLARVNPDNSFLARMLKEMNPEKLMSVVYTPRTGKSAGKEIEALFYKNNQLWPASKNAFVENNEIYRNADMSNYWSNDEISATRIANEGNVTLRRGKKPEALLKRIIEMTTEQNDILMDYFAGSGTTGAVAHKMGRKWIMVEVKENMIKEKALTRMKNVVNGDQTGISKEVGWKGGGGFKFYKLGEPLIVKHKDYPSIKMINPKYYNTALIKVICQLEGFKFRKDDKVFHGVNKLGNKYSHITDQYVSQGVIGFLKGKLGDNEELIIYCFNYDDKINLPDNILIKKLPGDLCKPYQLRLKV